MATPHCPHCNAQGVNWVAMQRLSSQVGLFYCNNCGAIYGVAPVQPPSPPKSRIAPAQIVTPPSPVKPPPITDPLPTQSITNLKTSTDGDALELLGNLDLSRKLPYDPEAIANRMRAAGLSQGSRYLHIAIDDGPPCCPQHKTEMVKFTIPAGYKNAGREVWLCPEFASCKQWELAK